MPRDRPPPPLDTAALERMALRYVERYATTRAKLTAYLSRKIRERGWADATAPAAAPLAERMAALGYIDDRTFAEARATALARRGMGARRVAQDFHAAGIDAEDRDALAADIAARALDAALAFARRRRIGPYAQAVADRAMQAKQLGAMLRAGHDMALARKIIALAPDEMPDDDASG